MGCHSLSQDIPAPSLHFQLPFPVSHLMTSVQRSSRAQLPRPWQSRDDPDTGYPGGSHDAVGSWARHRHRGHEADGAGAGPTGDRSQEHAEPRAARRREGGREHILSRGRACARAQDRGGCHGAANRAAGRRAAPWNHSFILQVAESHTSSE